MAVQLAAQVNNVAVFAEIIGTVVLSVVVFLAWVYYSAQIVFFGAEVIRFGLPDAAKAP